MADQEKKDLPALVESHPMDGLMPILVQDKLRLAEIMCKSGLMPASLNTPQKVFIALQMGHELGLSPMIAVNNITAINGKAALSADIMVAVVRKHPQFSGMEIKDDGNCCTVTIRRKVGDRVEVFSASFSDQDAKQAGLNDKENYKRYPKRMRKHRATGYCVRDAFPDPLAGFYPPEEIADVAQEDAIIVGATLEPLPTVQEEPKEDPVVALRAEIQAMVDALPEEQKVAYTKALQTMKTEAVLRTFKAQIESSQGKQPEQKGTASSEVSGAELELY